MYFTWQLLFTVNLFVALYSVLLVDGELPSVVYLVVNPFDVGSVTVIALFVQPVGLILAVPTVGIVLVPFVTVCSVIFSALSFALTVIV